MVEETNVGMIKKKKRRKKEGWSVPRSLATEEAQSYPSCRLSKASWHGRSQIPSSLKSLQIFKKHSPWQKKKRLGEETAYKTLPLISNATMSSHQQKKTVGSIQN
ncbi:hypothetical protein MGG_17738 [Pyricularia oryzae 70-15]|uniref:Uncharacterized protein n=1 Tax=Pyricularia oryzae (strain 70-15 / ATCC MYA-4617 / FGSC 8958) TaxID=242507 RepID=G4NHE1_PYRO7|nr:uncharacterized protein MGG_17738 [Pyricularia oryzae 70-15]EHA47651.1 hypothetical protein MGG_17738 [Pyricularia oryzae 70-15]